MDFSFFLSLLSPEPIYDGGKELATFIAAFISPVLLAMAISLRMMETSAEGITSGGAKWGAFLKDMAIWTTVLGLYFALASLITDLFNIIYEQMHAVGSAGDIMEILSESIDDIDKNAEDREFSDSALNIIGAPSLFITWLISFVAFVVSTAVIAFLQLGHAIAYSFALAWGLVAIPMSITSSFKLLKGWGIFSGVVLVWPIIHYAAFALFEPVFLHANHMMTTGDAAFESFDKANVYLIMTISQFLSLAIAIAAPFIAQSLISNSGNIASVVGPFAGAGMAAGAAMASSIKQQFSKHGGSAFSSMGNDIKNSPNAIKDLLSKSKNPSPEGAVNLNANGPDGSGPSPSGPSASPDGNSTSSKSSSSGSNSPVTAAAQKIVTGSAASLGSADTSTEQSASDNSQSRSSDDKPSAAKKQARRGAIINQNSKPR